MSKAVYAIPGLMPPSSTEFDLRVILPESGMVKLCVFCGRDTDEVHYCLRAHGFRGGYIKDPSYIYPDTPEGRHWAEQKDKWPQFLTKVDEVPAGTYVLKRKKHDRWAVPVTERADIPDEEKKYWLLEIPAGILPAGDTELELSINGMVRRYLLQRQEFGAYKVPDITCRYSYLKEDQD